MALFLSSIPSLALPLATLARRPSRPAPTAMKAVKFLLAQPPPLTLPPHACHQPVHRAEHITLPRSVARPASHHCPVRMASGCLLRRRAPTAIPHWPRRACCVATPIPSVPGLAHLLGGQRPLPSHPTRPPRTGHYRAILQKSINRDL